MAGTITHEWNGTILTITSDSGTSSADLKGSSGDIGPRGPQGPAGVILNPNGTITGGYATEAYVDEKIASIETGDIDLSNYYTKAEVDKKIDDIEVGGGTDVDLSNYYTKSEVDAKKYATETFVSAKIAEAQLGGEGGEIDLSAYRTLDNNVFDNTLTITNASGTMHIYSNGIQGADSSLWIGGDGEGCFTDLKIGTVGNYKAVATQEYVTQAVNDALAALDGDEVTY